MILGRQLISSEIFTEVLFAIVSREPFPKYTHAWRIATSRLCLQNKRCLEYGQNLISTFPLLVFFLGTTRVDRWSRTAPMNISFTLQARCADKLFKQDFISLPGTRGILQRTTVTIVPPDGVVIFNPSCILMTFRLHKRIDFLTIPVKNFWAPTSKYIHTRRPISTLPCHYTTRSFRYYLQHIKKTQCGMIAIFWALIHEK